MPASAVARRTPAITGMSGTCFGARGETEEDIGAPWWDLDMQMPGAGAGHHKGLDTLHVTEVTANSYFFAGGAILLSDGFASAGLASAGLASAAGWSSRSTLASARSLAT